MRLFRSKPSTTFSVLEKKLGKALYNNLLKASDPKYRAFASAASILGIQENDILKEAADRLGYPFLEVVQAIDFNEVSKTLSYNDYLSICSIPVVNQGVLIGFASCEPEAAKNYLPQIKSLPFFISTPGQIERALLLSKEKSRIDDTALGTDLLTAIFNEISSYKTNSFVVEITENRPKYRFQTLDGKNGVGQINVSGQYLKEFLIKAANCEIELDGLFVNNELNGFLVSKEEKKSGTNVIRIFPGVTQPPSAPALEQAPEDPPQPARATVKRVLLVDDNESFLRVISGFFKRKGIEVLEASDGAEALEILKGEFAGISLIVSDLHMPNLSGEAFLKEKEAVKAYSKIPTILLTSDDDIETEIKLIYAGADAFIKKNEDPRLLLATATKLLEKNSKQAA